MTLFNLSFKYLSLHFLQKGEILLDGKNINEYSKKSLRNHVGTVLQDPFIFARSIKDNIALAKDISDKELQLAISRSEADSFIKDLPHGIDEVAKEIDEVINNG